MVHVLLEADLAFEMIVLFYNNLQGNNVPVSFKR